MIMDDPGRCFAWALALSVALWAAIVWMVAVALRWAL